ncbi:hypothetical protein [Acinetobacter silvestris]|uniref:Outer membrane protein beta-barrel domain-containing protein n=1 Tax=Acinetobacter silvestris TaxID=1977882 RepID=A0A1Y3CDA0_9GAMM|nr:hypothetical protein [Acinetobacter silvestris]OTG65027.1 hypothetical protein B9T28_09510 [Acinetobacter silvestris]
MKIKRYLFLITGMVLTPFSFANSFIETFKGTPKINLNLYVFAADVDGSIGKGNIKYDVDQPFKETLKNLDQSFMAHIDVSKGKWGVYVDKKIVKISQEKELMQLPIALSTKLDQSSYGIYFQAFNSPQITKKNQNKLIVEPTIGIHHTKVNAKLTILNKIAETDKSWHEFYWGSRFKYNFDSPWNLATEITFGTENTISAQTYLGYRLPIFNREVNIRGGYRYLKQDYHSNNFNWDIRQHGPVIGLNLPIF